MIFRYFFLETIPRKATIGMSMVMMMTNLALKRLSNARSPQALTIDGIYTVDQRQEESA
jgi:hypothetical protein